MAGTDKTAIVRRAFELFANQAFGELVALFTPDVEWPDFRDASLLRGRDAVRAYWEEQFAVATPSALLGQVFEVGEEIVAVAFEQLYDLDGRPVGEPSAGSFHFRFSGDLIAKVEHSRLGEIPDEVLDMFGVGDRQSDPSP